MINNALRGARVWKIKMKTLNVKWGEAILLSISQVQPTDFLHFCLFSMLEVLRFKDIIILILNGTQTNIFSIWISFLFYFNFYNTQGCRCLFWINWEPFSCWSMYSINYHTCILYIIMKLFLQTYWCPYKNVKNEVVDASDGFRGGIVKPLMLIRGSQIQWGLQITLSKLLHRPKWAVPRLGQ